MGGYDDLDDVWEFEEEEKPKQPQPVDGGGSGVWNSNPDAEDENLWDSGVNEEVWSSNPPPQGSVPVGHSTVGVSGSSGTSGIKMPDGDDTTFDSDDCEDLCDGGSCDTCDGGGESLSQQPSPYDDLTDI
jgi:hypothetical protein